MSGHSKFWSGALLQSLRTYSLSWCPVFWCCTFSINSPSCSPSRRRHHTHHLLLCWYLELLEPLNEHGLPTQDPKILGRSFHRQEGIHHCFQMPTFWHNDKRYCVSKNCCLDFSSKHIVHFDLCNHYHFHHILWIWSSMARHQAFMEGFAGSRYFHYYSFACDTIWSN